MVGRSEPKAVPYDERFLSKSWEWLTDPEIKRLTMTPDFTREQQRVWFESLPGRSDYVIWGIEVDGTPIGSFGIKSIRDNIGEYWGYIGDTKYWGMGIGRWMVMQSLETAKRHGLAFLELRVLRDNERAVRLYSNSGFNVRDAPADQPGVIWMERQVS